MFWVENLEEKISLRAQGVREDVYVTPKGTM